MEKSIGSKYQEIEGRVLSTLRELELQSLRQEIDHSECENLARELGRYLQRKRRVSNLTIEIINSLINEIKKEKKNIFILNRKLKLLESEIGSMTRESINVNAAILQLEQILEMT